jgi:hypothetical protein
VDILILLFAEPCRATAREALIAAVGQFAEPHASGTAGNAQAEMTQQGPDSSHSPFMRSFDLEAPPRPRGPAGVAGI